MDLTPRQEAFALRFVECGDATQAYIHAYSTANMKPATINRRAFDVKGKTKARIKEIRDAIFDEMIMSSKELSARLSERARATKLIDDTGIRAGAELSKLMGYHEKTEVTHEVNLIRYVKAPKK